MRTPPPAGLSLKLPAASRDLPVVANATGEPSEGGCSYLRQKSAARSAGETKGYTFRVNRISRPSKYRRVR